MAEWLKSHPEIEIISRDRAGDYARAANLGAPQAVQVADRWHLLRNVQEALKKSIEPQQPDINNALNCARMDEVREGAELSEAEQKYATIIESACPEVRVAAEIARGFATMVRNRDASALDGWIARATSSEAPNTMRQFARNLIKDLSAVKASLTLPWSNGQLEGQIDRLKTIKRQMFGRANLKLLECRLLNTA